MREQKSMVMVFAVGVLALLSPPSISGPTSVATQAKVELPVQKVAMGDYEVVENWPRPLPNNDLSHDGWTWGSGAGVWAESPDKVWVVPAWRDTAAARRHAVDLSLPAHPAPHEHRTPPLFRQGLCL